MLSDFVKYVKQYWHDRPDKSTPLNADRLNHIENGIASNSEAINQIANAVVSNIVNDPEKIASMAAVYALQEKLGTGELPSDAPNAISAINTLYSNLPSPTGLLIQHGHGYDYNSTDDFSISITFEKSYTQWVQVFCNIPATMSGTYFHVATAHSITFNGCKLSGRAINIDGSTISSILKNPSEGIQWVAIGV